MNNCPSSGGLGQSRPYHVAGITDRSSGGEICEQCPGWEGAKGRGVDESGRRDPHVGDRPTYQGSIYMLTQ